MSAAVDAAPAVEGLILLAHGARDPSWSRPFEEVARRIAVQKPALRLQLAYLEFMSPDLQGAATALQARGCLNVAVLPMFLGTGGHVRKDLPMLLDAVRQRWPEMRFELLTAIGEVDSVMQAMADAALRAVDDGSGTGSAGQEGSPAGGPARRAAGGQS